MDGNEIKNEAVYEAKKATGVTSARSKVQSATGMPTSSTGLIQKLMRMLRGR